MCPYIYNIWYTFLFVCECISGDSILHIHRFIYSICILDYVSEFVLDVWLHKEQTIPGQNYMGVRILGGIKVVWIYGIKWGHKGIDSSWCGCQGEQSEERVSLESLLKDGELWSVV